METRPVICNVADVSFQIGAQVVLDNIRCTIHEAERIGVLGSNGSGKSSLLRILAGAMPPDSGEVICRRALTIGYLPQESALQHHRTIRQAVLAGAADILDKITRFEALPAHAEAAHQLEEEIFKRGGWELDRLVEELASHLALPDLERPPQTLSGGEQRRVALAAALIGAPDLLLLDEPTNHLDTDSIAWLETWLLRRRCTCLLVSHDRAFLDHVSTSTLEIENGSLYRHEGNYSGFLQAKSARQAIEERLEDKRQAFLRREVEWIRRGPKARSTKSKSRVGRFNQAAAGSAPGRNGNVEMVIPPADRMGKRVLDFFDVDIEIGGKTIVRDFDFSFEPGQRIGIIGSNGSGKTTFLRTILGEHSPSKGKIERGELTRFNYADQKRQLLNDDHDVFTEIAEGQEFVRLGEQQVTVWAYLRRFLFSDERIRTRVGRLSGGERNRLMLAKMLKNGGNFLILDEPTNDLDLDTLRILEEELAGFAGCVLVVSHDRYFLNRVGNGILAFEGDGRLFYQVGDYDYYLDNRAAREMARLKVGGDEVPAKDKAQPGKDGGAGTKRKLKWKEKRELAGMEAAILASEAEVARLERIFSDPDFFKKHGRRSQELTDELEDARTRAAELYERWGELEGRREE